MNVHLYGTQVMTKSLVFTQIAPFLATQTILLDFTDLTHGCMHEHDLILEWLYGLHILTSDFHFTQFYPLYIWTETVTSNHDFGLKNIHNFKSQFQLKNMICAKLYNNLYATCITQNKFHTVIAPRTSYESLHQPQQFLHVIFFLKKIILFKKFFFFSLF